MCSHSSLPLIFSPRVDEFQRQNISQKSVYHVYNVKIKEERSQSSDTFCLWRYKWNFTAGRSAQNIAFHLLKPAGNNSEMCGEVFIYIFLWNARFVAVGTYVFSRPTDFGRAPICDEFQLHSGGLHFSLRQLSHMRRALQIQIIGFFYLLTKS